MGENLYIISFKIFFSYIIYRGLCNDDVGKTPELQKVNHKRCTSGASGVLSYTNICKQKECMQAKQAKEQHATHHTSAKKQQTNKNTCNCSIPY